MAKSKLPCFNTVPQRKYILKDLNGYFPAGQVTAIIGPSGAGKTTLLNAIAGRVSKGKLKGKILINGKSRKQIGEKKLSALAAYIMQDDILIGNLTARESLVFSAALRRPFSEMLHYKSNNNKVQAIIEELGLDKCANTRIGTPLRPGISGGQRKRVAVGTELITDPSLLFLDEPTSGLDSSTARTLITTLKKLADAGRTIISTIHQPSSDIFRMFDKLIVMTEGHIMYQGTAKDSVPYFSQLNFKCPKFTNPAEFILDIAKEDSFIYETRDIGKQQVTDLVCHYRQSNGLPKWQEEDSSQMYSEGLALSSSESTTDENSDDEEDQDNAEFENPHVSNFFIQLLVLTIRDFLVTLRDQIAIKARLFQTIFFALLVGILYYDIGSNQQSIQDREGSLFFCIVNQAMSAMMVASLTLPAAKAVFIREHSSGAYSTLPYYLAKSFTDIPFQIIFPALFGTIVYCMVGYQEEFEKYLIFVLVLVTVTSVAVATALCIGSVAPSPELATILTPLTLIPLFLLGGFFINDDSIPVWLQWAKYLSFFKYGFEILVLNEFEGLTFTCKPSEETDNGQCPIENGDDVIRLLGMDNPETEIW
eukprot:CAMPEP_0174254988 /NCGR_PEP_ID=MMETSP0439-20130205/4318_1 /TAXON_ID=0 /ORGANISM="Stereomyxa ramosa, Strain Chinc5" /LENGTH=591 /DNA_ID=CAMNT_0015336919 /DNA_START=239 /DNA_END=2011 /DNA_ORIENTATION=-